MYISKKDLISLLCSCHTLDGYNDAINFINYLDRHFMSDVFSKSLSRLLNSCYFNTELNMVYFKNFNIPLFDYYKILLFKEQKDDC